MLYEEYDTQESLECPNCCKNLYPNIDGINEEFNGTTNIYFDGYFYNNDIEIHVCDNCEFAFSKSHTCENGLVGASFFINTITNYKKN